MKTIHRYRDGGHSWFKVKKTLLVELGIAEKITGCSYQLGEYAYLEEDQDMATFLEAYFKGGVPDVWWHGPELKTVTHDSNWSKVRTYPRYRSTKDVELSPGMRFKLYDKIFEAIVLDELGWIMRDVETLARYRLKKTQLSEIVAV